MIQQIEQSIGKLLSAFSETPHIFLTEDDVRCYLVHLLLQKPALKILCKTEDDNTTIPVHSEVRWYGQSGKLKYRSDVVVLDPSDTITSSALKLPSKGYNFNYFHAVIEIKFRRGNNTKKSDFTKQTKDDFKKLEKIHEEVGENNKHDAGYYLICLDKRNELKTEFEELNDNSVIKFYYRFAN